MMTDRSDLAAFEALVCRDSTLSYQPRLESAPDRPVPSSPPPGPERVRQLWRGVRRTLPGNEFPGLEGVPRIKALAVAGPDHAWPVQTTALQPILRAMSLADAPVSVGLRNPAVFLTVGMIPTHWADCCCGTTFFAHAAQVTLRQACAGGYAWVTRFESVGTEVLCLELYDNAGCFCAGLDLSPEALPTHRTQWAHWLRRAAVSENCRMPGES